MHVNNLVHHQVFVKLFSGLTGVGLVPLQQVLLLPCLSCSTMQHLARGLQPGQFLRHHQGRSVHAQKPLLPAACQPQQTKHGAVERHASDAVEPQDSCVARQAAAQPAAGPYRRWRSSTTSRSPQVDPAAAPAAGTSRTLCSASLRSAQQGTQQLQQQGQQATCAAAGIATAAAAAAAAAASRSCSTSSSLAPMRQRRVSSSLAAAVAAAANADVLATQGTTSVSGVSSRGSGVVAAVAATSSAGRSRSTSSSIEPVRRRRVSSSLVASKAAAATADASASQRNIRKGNSSSSSSRTASSSAVEAVTAAAAAQPAIQQPQAGLQAQVQQQQPLRLQQKHGPRGPMRSSTSSLWPVQQHRIQQQQQQQQLIPVGQQHQIQRLQQLCRNPDLHWQQVHHQHQQQSEHELYHEHEQQPDLTWQQQQQQLLQQWPAELVQPPAADESVLLDISALWRANQLEMLAGQQQHQHQQWHLLLEHQQVMWVAVHQPGAPGSPAAVWVHDAQLELRAQQLQLSGHGEQQQALVRLQRPDMGQGPAAVVEGLTFEHSSSLQALQENKPAAKAAWDSNGDAVGASGEAAAAPVSPAATAEAAGAGVAAAGYGACEEAAAAATAPAAPGTEPSKLLNASSSESRTGSSSSIWFDYLLLCSGEFSVVEHDNMFPNSLGHCGEGRTLHNARGAADVGSFVAEPQEPALRQHMINLIRQAWDRRNYEEGSAVTSSGGSSSSGSWSSGSRGRGSRGLDPQWVMGKILQRWGAGAMVKFGVDDAYFSARFMESGVVTLPAPTVGAAVPDISMYSSADVQQQ